METIFLHAELRIEVMIFKNKIREGELLLITKAMIIVTKLAKSTIAFPKYYGSAGNVVQY